MPNPTNRDSLTKDLLTRYYSQREGGAFEVRPTLDSEAKGQIIDAKSSNGQAFQLQNGFLPKSVVMTTQLDLTKQSTYVKGLDNRRYHG